MIPKDVEDEGVLGWQDGLASGLALLVMVDIPLEKKIELAERINQLDTDFMLTVTGKVPVEAGAVMEAFRKHI